MKARQYKIRLKKDDLVMVRAGKYKGQIGKVISTHPQINAVTVEGINIVKRHRKPSQAQPQGAIVELTKPMPVSKVGIIDPDSKRPSKIGHRLDDNGKIRIYKRSGKEIN